MPEIPALVIGARAADHLSLQPTGRSYPDATEPWDADWLHVDVDVRAGAFGGRFAADLCAAELAAFLEELRALHGSLKGEATLRTLEGWISVRIVADRLGHLDADCEVRDDPAWGSRLQFRLRLDQSHLPAMLEALEGIVREFPPIADPAGAPEA